MLMNFMAVGCFLVVAGVMAAMWKYDRKDPENLSQQMNETKKDRKGRYQK